MPTGPPLQAQKTPGANAFALRTRPRPDATHATRAKVELSMNCPPHIDGEAYAAGSEGRFFHLNPLPLSAPSTPRWPVKQRTAVLPPTTKRAESFYSQLMPPRSQLVRVPSAIMSGALCAQEASAKRNKTRSGGAVIFDHSVRGDSASCIS
jgi:hypothetical protein